MKIGMSNHRNRTLSLVGALFISLSLLPSAAFAILTPGTGVNWTLDDLVANSAGQVVTAPDGYLVTTGDINIAAGDTLTLSAGETLTFGDAGQIGVYGALNVVGTEAEPVLLTKAALPAWNGIRVYGEGSVNFDHGRIERAQYAFYFSTDEGATPSSAITNFEIAECSTGIGTASNVSASIAIEDGTMEQVTYGVDIQLFFGANLTISDVTGTQIASSGINIDEYYGSGLSISNVDMTADDGGSPDDGLYIYGLSLFPAQIDGVTMTGFSNGLHLEYGGGQLSVTDSTFQQSDAHGIVVDSGFGDTVFTNCSSVDNTLSGLMIGPSSYYAAGDGSTVTGSSFLRNGENGISAEKVVGLNLIDNTISDNGLNGVLADFLVAGLVRGNTISGNGIGINILNSFKAYRAASADSSWIEVNTSNADDWMQDADDDYLDEAPIGFNFPLAGADYTHFQMESNALIELETTPGDTEDISDYEGWTYMVDGYDDETFIFARTDDWNDTDGPVTEAHDGASVEVNGFGYKHFNAGDTDGDGNVIAEECTVITWYNMLYSEAESTPPKYNAFQVVLYPDGRIQWNTRLFDGTMGEYSQIQGAYINKANERTFIYAAGMDLEKGSYLYDPQRLQESDTRYFANLVSDNTNHGVLAAGALAEKFIGNTIDSNAYGIEFQTSGAYPLEATFNYNSVLNATTYGLVHGYASELSAENNYWGLTEAAEIDEVIYDDDEDGAIGAVDFTPFLLEAPELDCQAEAGPDQAVIEDDLVTLAGSNGAGSEAGVMAYLWAQQSGATVTLSSTSAAAPTFDAPQVDAAGDTLVFQLTTTDIFGETTTDTVSIEVGDTPIPVTAEAGADQNVIEGETVNLRASNAAGDDAAIAAVTWTQVGGASVTLTDATSADTSFAAPDVDADGETLTFQVSIVDIYANTTTDTVDIYVSDSAAVDSTPLSGSSGSSNSSCFIGSLMN